MNGNTYEEINNFVTGTFGGLKESVSQVLQKEPALKYLKRRASRNFKSATKLRASDSDPNLSLRKLGAQSV